MNNQALLFGIRALAAIDALGRSEDYAALKVHIAALNAAIRAQLPRKADGSEWTEADIETLAAEVEAKLDAIDARHGG